MLKNITSPTAVTALLLLAGATAIPTALAYGVEEHRYSILREDVYHLGVGLFALGVVFMAIQIIFKIRKWEHFARIKAVRRRWLMAMSLATTLAIYPGIIIYSIIQIRLFNEWDVATSTRIMVAWVFVLYILLPLNALLLLSLPRTKLPATMRMRYSHTSKELNAWRVFFTLLLVTDIFILATSLINGFVTGIVAAVIYMYILFALHTGKIEWKEEKQGDK